MRTILFLTTLIFLASCSSLDQKSLSLEPGLAKDEVIEIMGTPARRSFRDSDEAWQYQGVVGYGQCTYITTWFSEGKLVATTNRRGASIAGCGLGSGAVDWGQMPKPAIDINVNTN